VYFVSITVCDLIIVHIDWSYSDLFAGMQCQSMRVECNFGVCV